MRQLLLAGAVFSLLGLLVACGGGGGEVAGITPVPGIASGPSSQPAPAEGTFVIDLSTDSWIQVLPTFDEYLTGVSPDGKTILYRAFPAPNTDELFAVDLDASNRRKIGEGFQEVAFSPDGKTLAMWGRGQGLPVTLMDWPDGELVEIAIPAKVQTAVWSTKNELAVLTLDQTSGATTFNVYFVTRKGAVEREATRVASPGALSWAPDGSRLAFPGGEKVFTFTPGQAPAVLAQLPGARGAVSWSRDGALLAVPIGRPATADPRYTTNDIVVMDSLTGETRFTLVGAANRAPSWSPDEAVLLFEGNACLPEERQMLVNGDGTNLRPLSERHGGGLLAGYDWSPDGRRVVTPSVESESISIVDVETGETQTVFRSAGLLVDLRWIARDRLIVSTTPGTDACNQDLGETTRVVFP